MSCLIENILNIFTGSGERSMRIAYLQSRLIDTNTSVDLNELSATLQRLEPLFVTDNKENPIVSVDISVRKLLFFSKFESFNSHIECLNP